MQLPTIKQLMREEATFQRYQDGKLWYSIHWGYLDKHETMFATTYIEGSLFEFPIPVDDSGGGSFGPVEKAITLMRWIRKHLDYLNGALESEQSGQEDGS